MALPAAGLHLDAGARLLGEEVLRGPGPGIGDLRLIDEDDGVGDVEQHLLAAVGRGHGDFGRELGQGQGDIDGHAPGAIDDHVGSCGIGEPEERDAHGVGPGRQAVDRGDADGIGDGRGEGGQGDVAARDGDRGARQDAVGVSGRDLKAGVRGGRGEGRGLGEDGTSYGTQRRTEHDA